MDIQPFRPDAPLPTPSSAREFGINETLPAYRQPDITPAYRLKDSFLWNLHEALTTPDQFAKAFVDELDLPTDRKPILILNIANQIRQQLEEYAGVALHSLFHSTTSPALRGTIAHSLQPVAVDGSSTPAPPASNGVSTPVVNGMTLSNGAHTPAAIPSGITAAATALPSEELHNPDDTYRCIVTLNINLLNRLYTDKFEWSLLHPPGFAEMFAKVTCADLGLSGEWVSSMTHAIYEAVLRLKKEACENGGLVGDGEIDNDAVEPAIGAGWRYDHEHLCDEWEPKVEILSKEDIERREGDRERQIRRLRRETARFSSTANMTGTPQNEFYNNIEQQENMGRGERSKKKRRFRSLSPVGRDTPGAGSGYGGQDGGLQEGYVLSLIVCWLELTVYQGTTNMALRTLLCVGYCCLGCSRWTTRPTYPLQQLRLLVRTGQEASALVRKPLLLRQTITRSPAGISATAVTTFHTPCAGSVPYL
jgi:chromatin structure-remodeling complex subunit SFH1